MKTMLYTFYSLKLFYQPLTVFLVTIIRAVVRLLNTIPPEIIVTITPVVIQIVSLCRVLALAPEDTMQQLFRDICAG